MCCYEIDYDNHDKIAPTFFRTFMPLRELNNLEYVMQIK